MSKIHSIYGRVINDSRGEPTLEVEVHTEDGKTGKASVPNGISKGTEEVTIMPPDEAVTKISELIAPKLKGMEIIQRKIDDAMKELDGTEKKENLGGNTMLGVSLAVARAGAESHGMELYKYLGNIFDNAGSLAMPIPMFVLINGGSHADNNIDFQEFMAVPSGFNSYRERLEVGINIYETLRVVLQERDLRTDDGEEGGYAPDLETNEMAFGLISEAIQRAGYNPGRDVFLSLDVAASFLPPTFQLNVERYINMTSLFPIISLEDPLPQDDWDRWAQLKLELDQSNKSGRPIYLIGDDLFVTHIDRLKKGINSYVANAILVKINQLATLSDIFDIIKLAKENNYIHIISHRAGETHDTFIADLAAATGAAFIKAGAPNDGHPERMAKYHRLIDIEKDMMIS